MSILAVQNGPPVREGDVLFWVGLSVAMGVGFVVAKLLETRKIHLPFDRHRALAYVLIFPMLVIIPVCLAMGWRNAIGPILGGAIGIYLILFHVVGAACPKCGSRLRNMPSRPGLFRPLRQIRYRCTQCDFRYDRFDTEEPPF